MKRLFPHFLAIATMFALATGCAKSDADDPDSPNSNISVPDPEGTVTVSLRNANSGKTYLDDYSIYIDKADNFTGGWFVSLGKVKGLGNVTRIPASGWSSTIAVVPGEGYVAYSGGNFFRIYVVRYTTNVANEIIGAEIKFQRPFAGAGKLSLPKASVVFDSTGGEETLKFGDNIVPFSFTLDGGISSSITQLAGCEAEITHVERYSFLPNGITIRASENPSMNDVKHTVALKTVNGKEYEIDVTIKAAKPYMSLDKTTLSLLASGSMETFEISTNIAPEDLQINNEQSWIKVVQQSVKDGKIRYCVTCDENITGKERKGTITMYADKSKGVSSEITVEQAKHTFALSAEQVYFDRQQLSAQVTLTTTASVFSAKSDDESWCTMSCNKNVMTVRSVANDTSKNRTAHIIVTLNDGQAKTITVHQGIYTVGDTYDIGGVTGVVFDTYYDNGFHGKIVSTDYATNLVWSTENVETGATDENDGMKNMKIIRAIPNWKMFYPAFAWCAEHGDGWHLPSKNEILKISMCVVQSKLHLYFTGLYWSSTEESRDTAYRIGSGYRRYKSEYANVYAVYAF